MNKSIEESIEVVVGVDAFGRVFFIELPEETEGNFWMLEHLKETEMYTDDPFDTEKASGLYKCKYTVKGWENEGTPVIPSEWEQEASIEILGPRLGNELKSVKDEVWGQK